MTDPPPPSSETQIPRRGRRRALPLVTGGVGLLAVIGLIGLLARPNGGASEACSGRAQHIAQPAPIIEGRNITDGSPLRYQPGTITVVNVWGSWCGPCRLEQPMLARVARQRSDVRFLGLDVQDNDAAGRAFQREFDVSYPSISDQSRELASRLGAVATPATIVIDAGGTVRARAAGAIDVDALACMIGLASA